LIGGRIRRQGLWRQGLAQGQPCQIAVAITVRLRPNCERLGAVVRSEATARLVQTRPAANQCLWIGRLVRSGERGSNPRHPAWQHDWPETRHLIALTGLRLRLRVRHSQEVREVALTGTMDSPGSPPASETSARPPHTPAAFRVAGNVSCRE